MRNEEQRQAARFPKNKTAVVAVYGPPPLLQNPQSNPFLQPQSAMLLLEILVQTRLRKALGCLRWDFVHGSPRRPKDSNYSS